MWDVSPGNTEDGEGYIGSKRNERGTKRNERGTKRVTKEREK